jgi:hypothetical protein
MTCLRGHTIRTPGARSAESSTGRRSSREPRTAGARTTAIMASSLREGWGANAALTSSVPYAHGPVSSTSLGWDRQPSKSLSQRGCSRVGALRTGGWGSSRQVSESLGLARMSPASASAHSSRCSSTPLLKLKSSDAWPVSWWPHSSRCLSTALPSGCSGSDCGGCDPARRRCLEHGLTEVLGAGWRNNGIMGKNIARPRYTM